MNEKLLAAMEEAETKALDSLAGYKFQMFGYWAAIWVHLNRISGASRPNPFREIVVKAREMRGGSRMEESEEQIAEIQGSLEVIVNG